jgi:predicted ATPase
LVVTPPAGAFVGRQSLLRELGQALAGARAGRGELVIVTGEAGIGKTRLCEELVGLARNSNATVAWVACWQSGALPAFWPWEQLVAQLTKTDWPSPPRATAAADTARLELFEDIVAVLRREAEAQPSPLVLVIDDLHWADMPSVRVLEYLAPQLRDMPVVVAVTVRDDDVPAGTP